MNSQANHRLLFIFSLMLVVGSGLGLTGCGESALPGKPDLPQSVTPGWVRKSFAHVEPPPGLPAGQRTDCWKAEYIGTGTASAGVWTCGYAAGGAFDAAQRYASAADRVKFQVGEYLVIVQWSGGSKTEITALVRAVQNVLGAKGRGRS